jgi:sugar phosphate isomerase/epimerase
MASDAGSDGIELTLGLEATLRRPQAVRELTAAHDLRVLSVHPPLFGLPGLSRLSDAPRLVEFAAQVGASVVVQHTPTIVRWESLEGTAWRREIDSAHRLAADRGIILALENRAIFRDHQRDYALADPEALYRFAEEHDFGLTLDTSHAASWPWDVLEIYELYRDRLANLHLSDFKALPRWLDQPRFHTYIKHHQLPGAGVLPVRELMNRAQADGYAGLVTLEVSPIALEAWWPARIQRNLTASIDFLRHELTPSSMQN